MIRLSTCRRLVTTRDLKAGELILKESPAVVGPRMASVNLCLGCFAPRPQGQLSMCTRCGVAPICGPACEDAPGHSRAECALLQRIAAGHQDFNLLDNLQVD